MPFLTSFDKEHSVALQVHNILSVEEALEKILSKVDVLDNEEKPILDCLGQVLAEDVYSNISVPSFDNSAMDGYAVQWENIRGATSSSPSILGIIGEVAAGNMGSTEVGPGTAVRIMTGAPVPSGADTVVPFEDTDEISRRQNSNGKMPCIGITREVEQGANIRLVGEDISKGELVLSKGKLLRPAEIGVLASLGLSRATVVRRPIVAVLATGDELVEVGGPLMPGKIYNSNTYSLAAQVIRYGGIPNILSIARDTKESLTTNIVKGLDSDMLITSAGVSAGDYDMVKEVLAELGTIEFCTVRMKPGKPIAFGTFNKNGRVVPHLGLPGNPVSSMVAFEQFGRPAILKMLGMANLARPTIQAVFKGHLRNGDGRRVFARASVAKGESGYMATLTGSQGSNILTSMAQADGLIIVPEDVSLLRDGDMVQVQMLDGSQILS